MKQNKQNIEIKQLEQLSDKGRKVFQGWWNNCVSLKNKRGIKVVNIGEYYLPLITIGLLIQFLDCFNWFNKEDLYQYHIHVDFDGWHIRKGEKEPCYSDDELCDALWNAVKDECESDPHE